MKGVTIRDDSTGHFLAFDLIDILKTIGEPALISVWRLDYVEAIGDGAEQIHAYSDQKVVVSGRDLSALAETIIQVIEGEFCAYMPDEYDPWLIIRAVDGSEFDVESKDASILQLVRHRFKNVTDMPEDI